MKLPLLGVLTISICSFTPSVFADNISAQDQARLDKFMVTVSGGKEDRLNPAPVPIPKPVRKPTPSQQPAKSLAKDFVFSDKSVTRKIGQMVMVGFTGTSSKNRGVKAVMQQLKEGSIGGVMLMKHNIVSLSQVKRLTSALRAAARSGNKAPPLISVDQEGGYVQRLRFNKFPSAKALTGSSPKYAARIYSNLACEVHSAGINVNFGPVADVDVQGRKNPVIGRLKRSYSNNPNTVISYARQFVKAHKSYGVITAAKHFPGHGSSLKDSHKGFTAIPQWNRTKNELAPFQALANGPTDQRVEMIMVGHLYNKAWKAPATLSKTAISGMLRNDVNFNGVVITDDMEMGAIRKNYKWGDAIVRAVKAGNDILLYANTVTHDPFLGPKIRDTIGRAVCKSTSPESTSCISTKQIDDAFNRILAMKHNQARQAAFNRKVRCAPPRKKKLRQASTKRKAKRRLTRRTKQVANFN